MVRSIGAFWAFSAATVAMWSGLAFSPAAAADTACGDGPATTEMVVGTLLNTDDYILSALQLPLSPGAACSTNADCGSSDEKCEGGSCCVESGSPCSGLGYCCGHPSQGCVDGTCP
jgi:hypothetical protein